MKITRDKIYHQFVPEIVPQFHISPGDRLTVETLDAAGGRFTEGFVYTRPNPATGPIYVNGALPGDTLEIEIHDIKPIGKGYINIPFGGAYRELKIESLPGGNLHLIDNDIIFPADPMIGVVGVAAPASSPDAHYSIETGDYGGNMDNNAVKAGAKVYLPVFVEGALFGLGDIHAIMGDGEVFGQGIEICAEVDITVTVKKDMKIERPLVISDEIISTAASAATMEQASELAVSDMRHILEKYYGLQSSEAALAVAFYGNLRVCQIVNPQKTMRMEIQKDKLKFIRP